MIVAGQTQNFIVSYDNSLANGATLAQAVLDYCEYDLVRLSMLFGNILPPPGSLPIQINIVSGGGGGWNNGVNLITCTVNANRCHSPRTIQQPEQAHRQHLGHFGPGQKSVRLHEQCEG